MTQTLKSFFTNEPKPPLPRGVIFKPYTYHRGFTTGPFIIRLSWKPNTGKLVLIFKDQDKLTKYLPGVTQGEANQELETLKSIIKSL
jgi:hypothetical protein